MANLANLKPMRLGRAGDTIVEVLIAVGIVSLVLTGAYAVTNRNNAAGQKTQEQLNALKLVERQSELLLSAGANPPNISGCFDGVDSFVPSTSPACLVDSSGTPVDPLIDQGAKFQLTIIKAATSEIYTVNAQWTTLGGETANVSTYVRRAD
jgi:type II secretory pathway pseudopilin PulG